MTTTRCLYFACAARRDDYNDSWWNGYGCCSRACASRHYGEDAVA